MLRSTHGPWGSLLVPPPSSVPTFFTPTHPCLLPPATLACKTKPQNPDPVSSNMPIPPLPEIPPRFQFSIPLPQRSDLQQPT